MAFISVEEFNKLKPSNVTWYSKSDWDPEIIQVHLVHDVEGLDYKLPLDIETDQIENLEYVRGYLSVIFGCMIESYQYKNFETNIYHVNFTCDKNPLLVEKSKIGDIRKKIRTYLSTSDRNKFSYPKDMDPVDAKYTILKNTLNHCRGKKCAENLMSNIRNDLYYMSPDPEMDMLLPEYEVTKHEVSDYKEATQIINYLSQVHLEGVMIPYKGKIYVAHEHGDILHRDEWKDLPPLYFKNFGITRCQGATGLVNHI